MAIRSLYCPKCGKKTLNPYDKNGSRPFKSIDDLDHMWCMNCEYRIESTKKKRSQNK